MTAFRAPIVAFIDSLTTADFPFPSISRYVGYHYLQDMSNAPVYAADLTDSSGFVLPDAGKLTYGVTPQSAAWSRDRTTRVLTFAAPFVASANLPAADFPPAVSMLCTAVPGANGNVTT